MKKQTLKLILGYYLMVQAGIGVLIGIGASTILNGAITWAASGAMAYLGHWLVKSANAKLKEATK